VKKVAHRPAPTLHQAPPPRQRRWNHQLWMQGPRKLAPPTQPFAGGASSRPAKKPITGSEPPLVLVRPVAQREIIIAVDELARSVGIRPGMTLSEARALEATVRHAQHEPDRDAVALEALGRCMMRFSPVVALTPSPCNRVEGSLNAHGVFLDLTGCDRVFYGLDNLIRLVREAMTKLRITAHLAVAPNPGAAWALTYSSKHQNTIVRDDQLAEALADLPPATLRLDDELVVSLHHLGLNTIGLLMKLPRESLPARFGSQLLLRLDQALGKIPEPLAPLEPFSPISARMDFDGAVESLEAIWLVFKKLTGQVVAELLKRGRGARTVEVEFFRAYAVTLRKTIRLSRPSHDPVNLFNLLRCAMETIDTDVGFLGIQLTVSRSERVSDEQIALLEHEGFAGEVELSHLIERLCVRMGQEAVAQAQAVEAHVPERAWKGSGLGPPAAREPVQGSVNAVLNPEPRILNPLRPLHLFDTPEEIHVMVTPSHDRDGKPISFSRPNFGGVVHPLAYAIGPERIAGQWWRGHDKTRDYFDVEDATTGQRFWVFRVLETNRWFLHGEFE
jgi:protein ImuB